MERSIRALQSQIQSGEAKPQSLFSAAVRKAKDHEALGSFVWLADEQMAVGPTEGPLQGIPYAVKDIFCEAGRPTRCGSKILEGFVAPYESTVTERLKAAGAVSVGRTNMDEFGMGSSGENSGLGPMRNPWDCARVPGGSSGGSAAAVAAGIVPFSIGTDTGGSVRQPAAFCGVTGFKPSYGRASRYGMVSFASSLDCAGIFAESAEDCAIVLSVIAGPDARDSTCSASPVEDYSAALSKDIRGLRIGLPASYWGAGIETSMRETCQAAVSQLEALGAEVVSVDLSTSQLAIACYYVIASAEASSNLSRYDGVRYGHRSGDSRRLNDLYENSRTEGFGDEVKRRVLTGAYALSTGYYDEYYGKAQRVRRLIAEDFERVFASVDVLAAPVTPATAFAIGEKANDPIAMYQSDMNTVAVNLAGLPAMSIPCGFNDGLPVGLQLIAPAFSESRLLQVAHQYQKVTDWHRKQPGGAV